MKRKNKPANRKPRAGFPKKNFRRQTDAGIETTSRYKKLLNEVNKILKKELGNLLTEGDRNKLARIRLNVHLNTLEIDIATRSFYLSLAQRAVKKGETTKAATLINAAENVSRRIKDFRKIYYWLKNRRKP